MAREAEETDLALLKVKIILLQDVQDIFDPGGLCPVWRWPERRDQFGGAGGDHEQTPYSPHKVLFQYLIL